MTTTPPPMPEPRKYTTDFIRKTNDEYAAWCKAFYQPEALDERGMVSLHGLWAWQEQEQRITALEADRKMLREALESARGSLSGARSKARENPNLAESTCLHGISRIDEIVREVDARIALENTK